MAASPFVARFDDPRVTSRFCRRCSSDAGDVILVGAVHDHPASVARVERVTERVRPSTLALELPPAAVPLYRTYARDGDSPPEFGGEMSAAIAAAAPETTIYGIDAPNWSFCRRLFARLVADRVSPSTAKRVVSGLTDATRDALTCRVAATLSHATSVSVVSDDPIEYGCDSDDPLEQADHERAHVAGVQALLGGVDPDGDRSALRYRDETRERCMGDRLNDLRSTDDRPVVAVVGIDHLDPLYEALS
ncbi:hypothetical protein OB905_13955 [Halobacteria archaeon AArc-dxtr1]|nr:hypothetical protein [Halobacteria archaeon AArc-dxtr1]